MSSFILLFVPLKHRFAHFPVSGLGCPGVMQKALFGTRMWGRAEKWIRCSLSSALKLRPNLLDAIFWKLIPLLSVLVFPYSLGGMTKPWNRVLIGHPTYSLLQKVSNPFCCWRSQLHQSSDSKDALQDKSQRSGEQWVSRVVFLWGRFKHK
jgi:hypothetical protein